MYTLTTAHTVNDAFVNAYDALITMTRTRMTLGKCSNAFINEEGGGVANPGDGQVRAAQVEETRKIHRDW